MNVDFDRSGGVLVVEVKGRLESGDALQFEETVRTGIEEADRAVIMDFKELGYISSAGLRAVLMIAKNLKKREAALVVSSLPENIREVFRMSGLDKIITVQESRSDALAALGN